MRQNVGLAKAVVAIAALVVASVARAAPITITDTERYQVRAWDGAGGNAVDVTNDQAEVLLEEGRGWSLDEAVAFAERTMVET